MLLTPAGEAALLEWVRDDVFKSKNILLMVLGQSVPSQSDGRICGRLVGWLCLLSDAWWVVFRESPYSSPESAKTHTTTEDINSDYAISHDSNTNTSPSKWLAKKKTLEAVYKALLRYIREQCEAVSTVALEEPIDFNAIAEFNDKSETFKVTEAHHFLPPLANAAFKLLTIFLMAAIKGARIAHYVEGITTKLDAATQAEIAIIIQEVWSCQDVQ